jgi:hypothetical protein
VSDEYGSKDPQRFLDPGLDRLLFRLGMVRASRFVRIAAAYDDVFDWWSKMVRDDLAAQELVEVEEDDGLTVAYVMEREPELLEDEDGAPFPENVQKAFRSAWKDHG